MKGALSFFGNDGGIMGRSNVDIMGVDEIRGNSDKGDPDRVGANAGEWKAGIRYLPKGETKWRIGFFKGSFPSKDAALLKARSMAEEVEENIPAGQEHDAAFEPYVQKV